MTHSDWQAAWLETTAAMEAAKRDHDMVIAEMNKYVTGFVDPPPDLLDQAAAVNDRLRAAQDRQEELLRERPPGGGG